MELLYNPVVVEHVGVKAGIDIGDVFIGMHIKGVGVVVRSDIKEIGKAHLSMILLTLGADGSIVMTPSDYSALSSISLPKEKMGDSVGAGDAFSAGFIAALRQGAHLREAHQFANQFASFICTQNGAFVEIPPHFREKLQHYSPW